MKGRWVSLGLAALGFTALILVPLAAYLAVDYEHANEEIKIGQSGLLVSARDTGNVIGYNPDWRGHYDVLTAGTRARYLGPAPQEEGVSSPLVRIAIDSGDHAGESASVLAREFKVNP